MNRVAIIGLGLIGGSFALALRKHGFQGPIVGVGRRPTLDKALAAGIIDEGFEKLEPGVRHAGLIYLATPISVILDLLPRVRNAAADNALVTDVGSTKAQIVDKASVLFFESPVFIGGHPMAGSEKRGIENADADLFRGATYVLTPARREYLQAPAARDFRPWLDRFGARVVEMDAELHDEIVAWTSHLPQLVATALAATVSEHVCADDLALAGGGLRDTTRLADSPYSIWRDICLTNSINILEALDALLQKIEYLKENLRSRALQREFEAGQQLRERLRHDV
jgi:prephenate dehydrogenase